VRVRRLALAVPRARSRWPPPPKVTVAIPVQQKVTRYLEATGYASAISTTNLVARVQGFLQKINYKDGEEVKEGATLFVIEPEPYNLKLEHAGCRGRRPGYVETD
jgi:multidrug efflux pump subunit AcrA (membrane-fusion protein)